MKPFIYYICITTDLGPVVRSVVTNFSLRDFTVQSASEDDEGCSLEIASRLNKQKQEAA
jgi:hypothetical protein